MLKIFLPLCMVFFFTLFVPVFGQDTKAKSSAPATKQPVVKETPKVQEAPKSQETPAESAQEQTVKGTIKEIAQDASYIIVDDTKILVTKELLEDSYLEVGDKVEVTVEKTDAGLKAKSCTYIFEEESEPNPEENTPETEGLPKQ